jgi:hypothetical protein
MAYLVCPRCNGIETRRLKGFSQPGFFGDDETKKSPDGEIYIGYCYDCGTLYYYDDGAIMNVPELMAS